MNNVASVVDNQPLSRATIPADIITGLKCVLARLGAGAGHGWAHQMRRLREEVVRSCPSETLASIKPHEDWIFALSCLVETKLIQRLWQRARL